MRLLLPTLAIAGLVLSGCATSRQGWTWNGQTFASKEECLAARRAAGDEGRGKNQQAQAATVGAATAGTVTAIAGGNLGQTALVAGTAAAATAALTKRTC